MGKMSAKIKSTDMSKAAKEFTLPMIDIIKPKIAIALGMETFNALRKSCDLKPAKNMSEAVELAFFVQRYKNILSSSSITTVTKH